jgi:hypothetical protein
MSKSALKSFRSRNAATGDLRPRLRALVGELRDLDARLGELVRSLPSSVGFDPLAELCGTVAAVRTDLLADAIATLHDLGIAGDSDLRRRYDERQAWLEVAAAS